MQSFLSMLKIAPQSAEAKVNVFLTSFNPSGNKAGIFLEGKNDPSFIRINSKKIADDIGVAIETIILACKKDVIKAWEFFERRFPGNPRLLFFVDKDHDDLLGKNKGVTTQGNFFVTKYYSIENYLVTENAVEVILIDIWGLDSTSGAIQPVCQVFKDFQEAYRLAFLPWMAWHLAAKRLSQDTKIGNVKFSILIVNHDFEVALDWKPDMVTYLEKISGISNSISSSELDLVKNEIDALPAKVWLRGKQEIWCLIAFLDKFAETVNADEAINGINLISKLNSGNIIEILSPRLPCPDDLEAFLRSNLEAI